MNAFTSVVSGTLVIPGEGSVKWDGPCQTVTQGLDIVRIHGEVAHGPTYLQGWKFEIDPKTGAISLRP